MTRTRTYLSTSYSINFCIGQKREEGYVSFFLCPFFFLLISISRRQQYINDYRIYTHLWEFLSMRLITFVRSVSWLSYEAHSDKYLSLGRFPAIIQICKFVIVNVTRLNRYDRSLSPDGNLMLPYQSLLTAIHPATAFLFDTLSPSNHYIHLQMRCLNRWFSGKVAEGFPV